MIRKKHPTDPTGKLKYIIITILVITAFLLAISVAVSGCKTPRFGCKETSGKNYKVGYHPRK